MSEVIGHCQNVVDEQTQCAWTEGTLNDHQRCAMPTQIGSIYCVGHVGYARQVAGATARAIASEIKAHQWEHKQPIDEAAEIGAFTVHDSTGRKVATLADIRKGMDAQSGRPTRTFTREEVLTVLRTYQALQHTRQRDDVNDLIAIFHGM